MKFTRTEGSWFRLEQICHCHRDVCPDPQLFSCPESICLHLLQVFTQRLPSAKMCFVPLQPYQPFHNHLVQCVVIFPQGRLKVADLSATIYVAQCMVLTTPTN